MQNFLLKYNPLLWREKKVSPVNTLQLFITNHCNLRCRGCFYAHKLGTGEMIFSDYQNYILKYLPDIKKVILLGGEPTLHKDLKQMIEFNNQYELKTTVYSNGFNLKVFKEVDLSRVKIRVGVYGSYSSEKPFSKIKQTDLPLTIVYMLRRDNVKELSETAKMAEQNFNCQDFYISSIRDIETTQDYWQDAPETIPIEDYAEIIQEFVNHYMGGIRRLHLATRGVIITKHQNFTELHKCRFGNIFPDQEKIICPLDISKKILSKELIFNQRNCTKHYKCILQKIVLEHL